LRMPWLALGTAIRLSAGRGVASPRGPREAAVAKPEIHKMLIPYPKHRKREMAAYSKRHYGSYKWRLVDPKLIVLHYAEAGSITAAFTRSPHANRAPRVT